MQNSCQPLHIYCWSIRMHSLNTVYNYIWRLFLLHSLSYSITEKKAKKNERSVTNDSWNTWCHVYALYMHSNIQYVNLNTSMPIKEFTPMYIFSEDGEYVMSKRRHRRFFSPLYEFGANVEMFTQIIAQGHFEWTRIDAKNVNLNFGSYFMSHIHSVSHSGQVLRQQLRTFETF